MINKEFMRKVTPLILIRLIRRFLHFYHWDEYMKPSWSQSGEDLILQNIFRRKTRGFYVDVGAHHPKRFSNTYALYKRGWHGINIDPLPGSMALFRRHRPRDINIECGIGLKQELLTYYMFNEPAINTFSKKIAQQRVCNNNNRKIINKLDVPVFPLSYILKKHLSDNYNIDVLNIDVEGYGLEVLKSNDWEKYRPEIILVEVLNRALSVMFNDPVARFMRNNSYELFAKFKNTVFFKDQKKNLPIN